MKLSLLFLIFVAPACAFGTAEPKSINEGDGGSSPGQQTATASVCADPDTTAPCTACGSGKVCQLNGCYNGYLCDTNTNRCKAPNACP